VISCQASLLPSWLGEKATKTGFGSKYCVHSVLSINLSNIVLLIW
jgi:hypothetical protein